VDERFYHPTGAESYYGRKKKFKRFLQIFYNVKTTRLRKLWNRMERSGLVDSFGPRVRDSGKSGNGG
jgi:hypothetical protein